MPSKIQKYRLAAFDHQQGLCFYCKASMWLTEPGQFAEKHRISLKQAAWFQCTAEHLQARQDGGADQSHNIVAACRYCNHKRHARKTQLCPSKFKALIGKRLEQGRWRSVRLSCC